MMDIEYKFMLWGVFFLGLFIGGISMALCLRPLIKEDKEKENG